MNLNEDEKKLVKSFFLLTSKPVLYVANISEDEIGKEDNAQVLKVKDFAKNENSEVITISAKIEEDLASLEDDEKQMFMEELNLSVCGLDKLISASYKLLGLISYLTAGEKEVRAWTIKNGTKAPQAAGEIHSDFEKGFIKAEVIAYNDLIEAGTEQKVKELGKFRLEGKDYLMQDGDICHFRFNL